MEQQKSRWPSHTIRVFAVLNIIFGLVGFAAIFSIVTWNLSHEPWPNGPPFYAQVFYSRTAVNLAFVILLTVSGPYLWRLDKKGWTISKIVFFGEIIYFIVFDIIPFPAIEKSLGESAGIGNMGTGPQTLTGYPVIALVALAIAFSRLRRSTNQSAEQPARNLQSG